MPGSWPVPGKRLAKYAGGFGERRGVGAGVVESEEWSRGFGWEPLGAGGDDQPGALAVPTESVEVPSGSLTHRLSPPAGTWWGAASGEAYGGNSLTCGNV
jgi:hypothetical protein